MLSAGLVLAAALFAGPVARQTARAQSREVPTVVADGESFHVDLPEGATMTRRIVIDFAIDEVSVDGEPVLGVYEGFAANVSDWVKDRRKPGRQERRADGQAVEFFWNRRCGRNVSEVHAWIYPNLSEDAEQTARRIVDSVHLRECP